MNKNTEIANLLNEIGMLAHIPRSGFAFLGSGKQSVAEHSYRVAMIAYILSRMVAEPIDRNKLSMMCLFHDLPESRIGDLNYVQKRYVTPHLDRALEDISKGSFLGPEIVALIQEFEDGNTIEAKLARDADQLELLLVLKREEELGNIKTADWIHNCQKRLQTEIGKQIGEAICNTPSDAWWLE